MNYVHTKFHVLCLAKEKDVKWPTIMGKNKSSVLETLLVRFLVSITRELKIFPVSKRDAM
jgi:hypothetical protein